MFQAVSLDRNPFQRYAHRLGSAKDLLSSYYYPDQIDLEVNINYQL